jgi:NAD+ synthase (glutamine-hydrolysing)
VHLRIALAQINTTVGDLTGNVEVIHGALDEAEAAGADVVAFPELAVTGYPPEDLLLKPAFVEDNLEALAAVAAHSRRTVGLVGFVDREGEALYNALAVVAGGEVRGVYRKRRLPNYAVFDERRYFTPGEEPLHLYRIAGVPVGVSVCEDAWAPGGPIVDQAASGAALVVNVNASPYHAGKVRSREEMLAARADEACCTIAYVNQVGGQDELVFDGASLVVDPDGRVVARGRQYEEELLVVDLELEPAPFRGTTPLPVVDLGDRPLADDGPSAAPPVVTPLDPLAEVYGALVLGTRDYCVKNGFTDVVLGLSGGVDSSLVAAVATDALGPDHVHGVLMPSRYSSGHSVSDAERLADNLGIDRRTIVIEPAFEAFLDLLAPSFEGRVEDTTEENLQPRIRGTLLMALSNKFGWLVLTTGNKSEMAVGYATLYGDMAGGFAVIKDVPKTVVFALCRDRNDRAGREVIPESVITKPPSAELRADQLDTDSLPPYEVLDPILTAYIEHDRTAGDLIEAGHDPELVRRIVRLVDLAEYKRRQAPPGVRVTTKAFGKDRRLPITHRYRG